MCRCLLLAGTGAVRAPRDARGDLAELIAVGSGRGSSAGARRRPPTGAGTLVLADSSVSSLHARITEARRQRERPDSFEIQDLGSTNGTSVDGRAAHRAAPLRDGRAHLRGRQVLVFRMATPAELAAIEEDAAHPFAPVPTLSPALAVACSRLRRLARRSRRDLPAGRDRRRQGGVRARRSTSAAAGRASWWPSTAPPSRASWSRASSSATRRGPTRPRRGARPGSSRRRRAGRCSSTSWARCRSSCSPSCCASCRTGSSPRSVRRACRRPTCASSPPAAARPSR